MKRAFLIVSIVVTAALLGLLAGTFTGQITHGVFSEDKNQITISRVIDGDTVELATGERVRLLNIDTPEKGQYFSAEATDRLEGLVLGRPVRLEADEEDTDKYGRLLRHLFVDEVHINLLLVEEGYARALIIEPNTNYADEIVGAESAARAAQRGLWQFDHITDAFCIGIHYFHANAAGNDNENLNDEFVRFRNACLYAVDMTGWTLQDASNKTYVFPVVVVEGKTTMTVHSGQGTDNETDLFWGNSRAVWNNNGDRLQMWNADGTLMLDYAY